jgi:hypothetical protein
MKRVINRRAIRQQLNEAFVNGLCSSMSIFGMRSDFHLATPEDDADALASDWESVGQYIYDASQKLKR